MSQKTAQSGTTILIALILLVLAAGAGMWFYLQKDISGDNAIQTQTTLPAETGADVAVPQATQDDAPSADVSDDAVSDDATSSTDGASSAINVDEIMGVRALGNPDAPVRIIEYASLTCSHCAHFHNDIFPQLKEKYIDTGKVYFEFREFPLNDPALKATITARCLPKERYEGFISLLFKTQEKWASGIDYMAMLKQNSRLAGLSEERFNACHENGDIKLKIAASMQEAQDKWKISATPSFIINEGAQTISGAQPLENFERAFRDATNGAVGDAPKVE